MTLRRQQTLMREPPIRRRPCLCEKVSSEAAGRMSLYTVLNKLIKSNGLRNTAGPTYAPLDPVGTKQQAQLTVTAEKQSNAKWQSIYPGIAVSVTVEGLGVLTNPVVDEVTA